MRPLVPCLLATITVLAVAGSASAQPSGFCDRHPTNPKCKPPPSQPPPPATGNTYRVSGKSLLDPCGEKVVVRGVEQMLWQTSWLHTWFVSEIARTGANTVRVLPQITQPTPTGEPPLTLAETEDAIQRGIAGHMLVDLAVNGAGTQDPNVSTWLRSDVVALAAKYAKYLVIHAKGESYESTASEWVANAKSTISQMRAAGYTEPLYILPTDGGRNLPNILNYGAEIEAADPLHNVMFGWESYWGASGYYQNKYGMSLHEAMGRVRDSALPIQVGVAKIGDYIDGVVNYLPVIADAQAYGIGWLWWDWRMSDGNLTTDGVYGHWAPGGEQVAVTDPNSIANTSTRTYFQRNGTCA